MNINVKHWFDNNYLSTTNKLILVLSALHYEKIITDEKYKGQISALRKGTLQQKKGTFKSTINGKWYDHESPVEIFSDYLKLLRGDGKIPFEKLMETLMLFNGNGWNYSINVFQTEFL